MSKKPFKIQEIISKAQESNENNLSRELNQYYEHLLVTGNFE